MKINPLQYEIYNPKSENLTRKINKSVIAGGESVKNGYETPFMQTINALGFNKVEQIKTQISSGTYNVPAEDVAEKVLMSGVLKSL